MQGCSVLGLSPLSLPTQLGSKGSPKLRRALGPPAKLKISCTWSTEIRQVRALGPGLLQRLCLVASLTISLIPHVHPLHLPFSLASSPITVLETSRYCPEEAASLFARYDHLLPKANPGRREKAQCVAPLGSSGERRCKPNDPSHPNPLGASDHRILRISNLVKTVYDKPPENRFSNFVTYWNRLEDIKKY